MKRTIEHIPVIEVVPDELKNEALPLVIYYHGWETSKELALTPARKIAAKKIRVILPDAMYHGERRVEKKSMIPSFAFWSSIQHNLIEFDTIIDYYLKRDLILDDRIGVAGFSMGGMTTSGLLTKHPEIKVASILMGTPSYQGFIDRLLLAKRKYHVNVPDDLEDILFWTTRYDLNTQPETLAGRPLYFWHGTDDIKIPYSSSHDFYKQYKDTPSGRGMVYETGENKPHILTPDIMEHTAEFFSSHL